MSDEKIKVLCVEDEQEINDTLVEILTDEGFEVSSALNGEEAVEVFLEKKILYGPGKAANAGGVATSGLEMSQNSLRMSWTSKEVDEKLHSIMVSIHEACAKYGRLDDGTIDYVKGANVAGFVKVADAMIDQGIV